MEINGVPLKVKIKELLSLNGYPFAALIKDFLYNCDISKMFL
jgi:hypothetical protein